MLVFVLIGGLVGLAALVWGGFALSARSRDRWVRSRLRVLSALSRGSGIGAVSDDDPGLLSGDMLLVDRSHRSGVVLAAVDSVVGRWCPLVPPVRAAGQSIAAGIAVFLFVALLVRILDFGGIIFWIGAVLAFALGVRSWLRVLQARAEFAFIKGFPEIIDQVVRVAASGQPPLEALISVSRDARPPIGPVLKRLARGVASGLDVDQVLERESRRVRLPEFTMLCVVLRLQRRSGGAVSGPLSGLSGTLRERRAVQLKVRAATSQARFTMMLLAVMPLVVLGAQSMFAPESVAILLNTPQGITVLRFSVALIFVGLFVCRLFASRVSR